MGKRTVTAQEGERVVLTDGVHVARKGDQIEDTDAGTIIHRNPDNDTPEVPGVESDGSVSEKSAGGKKKSTPKKSAAKKTTPPKS